MKTIILGIILTVVTACSFPAAAQMAMTPEMAAKAEREKGKVIGFVKENPRLTMLAKLLVVTKLDENLADPPATKKGRYSLFAPSDDAFHKMPQGVLDDLMKPENADKLKSLISYHIVVGKFTILPFPQNVTTENGERISVTASVKGSTYGTAKVEENTTPASNGIIYIIDTVQIPPEKK